MKIIGYHGTTSLAQSNIEVHGAQPRRLSRPRWLGTGVYFFQDAEFAAWQWAQEVSQRRAGDPPIVWRAEIDLSDAVDFTDLSYWPLLRKTIDVVGAAPKPQIGPEALFRSLSDNELEQLYLNHEDDYYVTAFSAALEAAGISVRAIRAAFIEGSPVHPRSWLFDRAHVQVCVRDPSVISNAKWIELNNRSGLSP